MTIAEWIMARRLKIIFTLAYALVSVYTLSYYLQVSALGDKYYRVKYQQMVDGNAWKPFAYRVLFPGAVSSVDSVTPDGIKGMVASYIEHLKQENRYQDVREFMPWFNEVFPDPRTHYVRAVGVVLMYGVIVLYAWVVFLLARAVFPRERAVAYFAPLLALMALTSFSYPLLYLYDYPAALLTGGCFYALYISRLRLYLLLFFLACLNKETSVFILVFFTLWSFTRMDNRPFFRMFFAQVFIYLAVKAVISLSYISNPGVFLDTYTSGILTRDWLAVADLQKILSIGLLFFLLTFRWQDKPDYLKTALWLLPLYFFAYILYGRWNEYRVFIDLHPPLVLLATHTLVVGTGIAQSPVFKEQP